MMSFQWDPVAAPLPVRSTATEVRALHVLRLRGESAALPPGHAPRRRLEASAGQWRKKKRERWWSRPFWDPIWVGR